MKKYVAGYAATALLLLMLDLLWIGGLAGLVSLRVDHAHRAL